MQSFEIFVSLTPQKLKVTELGLWSSQHCQIPFKKLRSIIPFKKQCPHLLHVVFFSLTTFYLSNSPNENSLGFVLRVFQRSWNLFTGKRCSCCFFLCCSMLWAGHIQFHFPLHVLHWDDDTNLSERYTTKKQNAVSAQLNTTRRKWEKFSCDLVELTLQTLQYLNLILYDLMGTGIHAHTATKSLPSENAMITLKPGSVCLLNIGWERSLTRVQRVKVPDVV